MSLTSSGGDQVVGGDKTISGAPLGRVRELGPEIRVGLIMRPEVDGGAARLEAGARALNAKAGLGRPPAEAVAARFLRTPPCVAD